MEKEVAVVVFPLIDGRFDYFGFSSSDEQTHAWCRDIFTYYWKRTYPRLKLTDELFWWLKQQAAIIQVFKQIAQRETVIHKEMISVLEEKFLVKKGHLTILGDHVYHRLLKG